MENNLKFRLCILVKTVQVENDSTDNRLSLHGKFCNKLNLTIVSKFK